MTSVALLSPGTINFEFLAQRTGSKEGGRKLFEQLVEDIVGLEHPDVATVQANPGDWGIDAFVGQLIQGKVSVWQAKYFIDGFGAVQQGDVRDAYKSAQKAASENGYELDSWTLAIPIPLDGPMTKWWQGWRDRTARRDKLLIDLWDEGKLRRKLMRSGKDAAAIREQYFNPVVRVDPVKPPLRALQRLTDAARYEDALFVRQMLEANLQESRQAREEFYNAEILSQEVADKGVQAEMDALNNWQMRIASAWSYRFNDACARQADPKLPGFFAGVMAHIEGAPGIESDTLSASSVHGFGIMHQHVEQALAGWVRYWPDVARQYYESGPVGEEGVDQ